LGCNGQLIRNPSPTTSYSSEAGSNIDFTYTWPMPHHEDPSYPCLPAPPLVRTRRGRRTLEFIPGDIQSEMLLARPDALVLAYQRAMMCFVLFAPRPRHIVMVGLGGGSLAKFCHRHFPGTHITVIEVRADVIALRDTFHVPPDGARFTVVHADAADWLARHPDVADVLLVDGFDANGLPPRLADAPFYAHCRRSLRPGGVLVSNVFTYDARYREVMAALDSAFRGRTCWFDKVAGNNRIMYALNLPDNAGPENHPGARRLARLARRRGLGAGLLNRLFVRLVLAGIAARTVLAPPHPTRMAPGV
jgi:spermidine synthase